MREVLGLGLITITAAIMAISSAPVQAVEETEQRVQKLEEEVRQLKLEMKSDNPTESEKTGSRLSFHGYGELHYNHPVIEGTGIPSGDLRPTLDFHRLVFGFSYVFNDRLSLHTEIDFEHAAQEIELEFAYLEYQFNDGVNLRVGSLLMPVGPLNEFHEPPNFYSVERPYVQKYIIPTTWQEGGIGLFGQPLPGLKYRVYLVEGLDATGFTAAGGIKDGLQVLSEDENKAFNFGGVGRLEYTGLPGLAAGASLYSAGAAQGDPDIRSAQVTLWDVDFRYRLMGLDLTALYATSHISGADRISTAPNAAGETIGSEQVGWYLEGAYNFLRLLAPQSEQSFVAFLRYEDLNTQDEVPAGFTADPVNDRQVITGGLAYYPHPDVALKADVENWEDGTDDKGTRFNLGVAYAF
jgi:hypothetical protein